MPFKSGKLTKQHLITWFKEDYFPNTPDESIFLVDSWTTYNDKKAIDSNKPEEKSLEILKIPPKTTSLVQPLDVFFFRKILQKNFLTEFC